MRFILVLSLLSANAIAGDREKIRKTIQAYIAAGVEGKASMMRKTFHKDATFYSIKKGKLAGGSAEKLFAVIDGKPAPKLTGRITKIDLNHNTATVRLELYDWGGMRFTDQHTLVKIGGEWKILHKVYYMHPKR